MSRYFFDVHEPRFSARDDEGTECSDRKVVTCEALRALCQIAADSPEGFVGHGQGLRVIVRDDQDRTVLTASLNLTAAWHAEEEHQAA